MPRCSLVAWGLRSPFDPSAMRVICWLALPCVAGYQFPWLVTQPSANRHCVTAMQRGQRAAMQAEAEAPAIIGEETYRLMMKTLLETERSVADEISMNYQLVDFNFLQHLQQRIHANDPAEAERLHVRMPTRTRGRVTPMGSATASLSGFQAIQEAVNVEMGKRMQVSIYAASDRKREG